MGDFLLEEQHRVLKLGHVLKTLALPYSAKHLLTDEDAQQFKKVLYEALEEVNKLSKYLLLEECQIDEENIFKTIQLFLEQQLISGNIKEDLDEFTRFVALDSAFSQLMTLRLCLWRDPSIKQRVGSFQLMLNTNSDIYKHEIYSIGKTLGIEESEPVKVLEGATNKINEMKSTLPLHCLEPVINTPIQLEQHTKFDEINTHFKVEYARLKLRYVESFDRSFRNMMTGVSDKHEKYLRVKQERARIKIESSFSLWDTYNARWDLVTELSRCSLRRREHHLKGQHPAEMTTNINTFIDTSDDENAVKTYVENVPVEHVVTKAQKKYAKTQQAKQKKKDQKKRRKLKELGLLDAEEEKKAETGEDNTEENDDYAHDEEDVEPNENIEDKEPEQSKKKNRSKTEKQDRRLKKKTKKESKTDPVPTTNNNSLISIESSTAAPVTKTEKKKQKFVVVVDDDGGMAVDEKN